MPEIEFNEIREKSTARHFARYHGADIKKDMVYYKESDSGISFGKDSVIYGKKNLCFGPGIQRSRFSA